MAMSRCPKCENSSFELKEASPRGSSYKFNFIQCASCGAVVGVADYWNVPILLEKSPRGWDSISSGEGVERGPRPTPATGVRSLAPSARAGGASLQRVEHPPVGRCGTKRPRFQGLGDPAFTEEERAMRELIAAATTGLLCVGIAQACDDHHGACEIEDWRWYSVGDYLNIEGVADLRRRPHPSQALRGRRQPAEVHRHRRRAHQGPHVRGDRPEHPAAPVGVHQVQHRAAVTAVGADFAPVYATSPEFAAAPFQLSRSPAQRTFGPIPIQTEPLGRK